MRLVCFEKEVAFFREFHGMGVVSKSLIVMGGHHFPMCREVYHNSIHTRPWHNVWL